MVKIDGSFVRDLLQDETNRIFVQSIIDIAHSLNIKAVAEFVENGEVLEAVREMGADYVQGFVTGKPFVFAPSFPKAAGPGDSQPTIHEKAG